MTIACRFLVLSQLIVPTLVWADASSSAHYDVPLATLDGGGGPSQSSHFAHEISLEGFAAGESATLNVVARHGYTFGVGTLNPYTDLDGDGLPDTLEYFLNLKPDVPDMEDAILRGFVEQGGMRYQTFGYRRHVDAPSCFSAEVLRSTDLLDEWVKEQTIEIDVSVIDPMTERVTLRSTIPFSGLDEEYLKLSVISTADKHNGYQSDPVGIWRKRTISFADTLFGTPMWRPVAWEGPVAGISGSVLTLPSNLLEHQYAPGNDTFYVLIVSGALEGLSYTILGNTETTLTLDPNALQTVAEQGLQNGDRLRIIPYWSLGSLFSSGAGIAVTGSDVLNPVSTVKLYDATSIGINLAPKKTYFYHDGSILLDGEGWYDNDLLEAGRQDHVVIPPESYLLIRNSTALAEDLLIAGHVPVCVMGTAIGRINSDVQDNLTVNPYPAAMTLGTLGIAENGLVDATGIEVLSPIDTLKLYMNPAGFNPAPNQTYFYHDGSVLLDGEGWYDNDDLEAGLQDNVDIPAGAPVIVRKAPGSPGTVLWIPALPYTP